MSVSEPVASGVESDFDQARELFLRPPKFQYRTSLFTISLILFLGIGFVGTSGSPVDLALLVGVLIVHELGHAIAMRIVGYRDVRIFFIPLFGAAASGRRTNVASWKEAIVLLAGPVPGIVAAYVLAIVQPELWSLVLLLVGLNAINLLPVIPLDGGQLFRVLVFSRHRVVELVFLYVTAFAMAVVAYFLEAWMMVGLGVFIIAFVGPQRGKLLEIAYELRPLNLPADPDVLDEHQTRLLHRAAWRMLPPSAASVWRGKPKPQAETMRSLLETATQRPPGAGATVALFGVWLGAWALAFATVFAMPVREAPAQVAATGEAVDWLGGDDVAGFRATMSLAEVVASCKHAGNTAFEAQRTFKDQSIRTAVCDLAPGFAGNISRVEVWFCGTQACVFELVSNVGTDYQMLVGNFSKERPPEEQRTTDRCARHDPPACAKRSELSKVWLEPGAAGVRVTRTVNGDGGDAPVYMAFANAAGMLIWR